MQLKLLFFPLSSFTHLSSSRLLQDGRQLELIPACSGLRSRHEPSALVALLLNISLCTACSKTNGTEGIICSNFEPSLGTLVTDGLRGRPSLCSHHQLITTIPGRNTSMTNEQPLTFVRLGVLIFSTTVKAACSTLRCAT